MGSTGQNYAPARGPPKAAEGHSRGEDKEECFAPLFKTRAATPTALQPTQPNSSFFQRNKLTTLLAERIREFLRMLDANCLLINNPDAGRRSLTFGKASSEVPGKA